MTGFAVEVQTVDLLEPTDLLQALVTERQLPVKRVQHYALQQIAQRDVVVLRQAFEDLEQALLQADSGLNALDLDEPGLPANAPLPSAPALEKAGRVATAWAADTADTTPASDLPARTWSAEQWAWFEGVLRSVGRGSIVVPLYEELLLLPGGRARAAQIYHATRNAYHPVIAAALDRRLRDDTRR